MPAMDINRGMRKRSWDWWGIQKEFLESKSKQSASHQPGEKIGTHSLAPKSIQRHQQKKPIPSCLDRLASYVVLTKEGWFGLLLEQQRPQKINYYANNQDM
uniref:Uncharacterized protein n=1 Tax=Entomoneis paludosa TaxID=265537 RepID=A0A7S3DWE6_9STRA|mmetsp:Transcript_40418/g.84096  ORF Transcript_40418/g.84096 Transcript_40418/m.84096 type:complete len:101 (+) Transcript_40418:152-454(+)